MVPDRHDRKPGAAAPTASRIPVADANLTELILRPRQRLKPPREPLTLRQTYMGALLVLVTFVYLQLFGRVGDTSREIGTTLRYLLWPVTMAAIVMSLQRLGPRVLLSSVAIVIPFFLMGVVSSIFSDDAINSARAVIFWSLGVLGAAVIANEVSPGRLINWLVLVFFGVCLASAMVSIAFPSIGRMVDLRASSGVWIGILIAKNQLGAFCVLSLIAGALATGIHRLLRCAVILVALVCLYGAHSGGADVQAVFAVGYAVTVLALRRAPLSAQLRIAVLNFVLGASGVIVLTLRSFVLELLGRDSSLTGRDRIWPAYFARALDYWTIGAGPGSFTQPSLVTIDIGASLEDLGTGIHSPHNMFIAAFGEIGLFGLIAFAGVFLYFALFAPFRGPSRYNVMLGTIAAVSIVGGMVETREVFGLGMNMFLLILVNVMARRDNLDLSGGTADLDLCPAAVPTRP